MRQILLTILVFIHLISFSQKLSENDIKIIAEEINDKFVGMDAGNGVIASGCYSIGRTLIYKYDVSADWYATENMKETLIANIKEMGVAKMYFENDVNADFHYYYKNILRKRISVKSHEFSPLNFNLDEYISIKDHPKAKGINLKIKPPIGWEIKEGDRPNIVKKFVYEDNMYLILTKDNFLFLSRNEARNMLSDKDFIDSQTSESISFLKKPKIIKQRIIDVGSYPTLEFTYKGTAEYGGFKFEMFYITWVIYFEDKFVFLQAGSKDEKKFETLKNLYSMITNSVIFPEKYD